MSGDAGLSLRDGRYVVTRTLGEGAQGDTLEAIDKRVGKLVAIKRFRVRGAARWKDVELAEREARVLASLSHPSLPAHIDHFEEEGVLYLVMEKIDGETLGALRKRGATLGRDDVLRFLRDIAGVLDYLHGRAPPVIHRDIKPNNVIRRPDGSFAVVDFGAVRDRMRPEGGSTVVGTFGYMAPEQFQGRALPGSDVYAAGATALAMLTGEEPEDLPHQGLAIDVAAALRGRADPALIQALAAMLEPDPDRRPARLAPLLAGLDAGRAARSPAGPPARASSAEPPRRAAAPPDGQRPRDERRAAWRSERDLRRGHQQALRELRRAQGGPLAGLPLVAALFGLVIARVGVVLALGVFVPLALTLLSIVFGRPLREAAARVRQAGHDAERALDRANETLRSLAQPGQPTAADEGPTGRARIADEGPTGRVRIEDLTADDVRRRVSGDALDEGEDDDISSEAGAPRAQRASSYSSPGAKKG
jgi:tRNA A-37 threonylcarbamoyl transferase component Bud32